MGYRKVLPALVLFSAMLGVQAQSDSSHVATNSRNFAPLAALPDDSPAPHSRGARAFHWGPFVNYGNGISERSDFRFLSAGVEAGKALTPVLHAGPLSGQFELAGNIMPVWSSFTPAPHTETKTCVDQNGQTYSCQLPVGGGNYFGFSVTPVIFRWKFATPWKVVQPWFQGQGGVVYTTHKFPPDVLVVPGMSGGTSVWNFTSGAGLGTHIFVSPKRSVDVHVNAIHLSSASLGDRNPGVNAQIQVQLGYTFWR
ncbi:acyloxyacyl hydrolase [Occallatibacter riparius]|uniref:Acyloxyacyl hydrolase n=1 Tax=Occallatibacter riparius TaxID=1002689 RepID=A0A9J7BIL0_9BACT|nr:acyloxyacyl hydrolase [Occallatibacter riparius]UWZ82772.1 acyloxyacyl hydrolase [Occallatibacter riparius]